MLTPATLRDLAQARLQEAEVLLAQGHPASAHYLGGYAVELTLKACVCDSLNWADFPETPGEFKNLSNFRTHDLNLLLLLSGRKPFILSNHAVEWREVFAWNPEERYRPTGSVLTEDARGFLNAVARLLSVL